MDLHLREKVIIVTGGARGIGKAIARALVEEGTTTVIVDKSEEPIKTIPDSSQKSHVYKADLSSHKTCREVMAS
jgi:NAD(P)-dependent dehydrogenase (short-subunit alcohol dehydrogenase family)